MLKQNPWCHLSSLSLTHHIQPLSTSCPFHLIISASHTYVLFQATTIVQMSVGLSPYFPAIIYYPFLKHIRSCHSSAQKPAWFPVFMDKGWSPYNGSLRSGPCCPADSNPITLFSFILLWLHWLPGQHRHVSTSAIFCLLCWNAFCCISSQFTPSQFFSNITSVMHFLLYFTLLTFIIISHIAYFRYLAYCLYSATRNFTLGEGVGNFCLSCILLDSQYW